MATLWITEYSQMSYDGGGFRAPAPLEPALAVQTVTIGAGSAQSEAFHPACRIVLLTADADCHIAFGADPTATTGHQPVWTQAEVWRGVQGLPEQTPIKLAVIQAA